TCVTIRPHPVSEESGKTQTSLSSLGNARGCEDEMSDLIASNAAISSSVHSRNCCRSAPVTGSGSVASARTRAGSCEIPSPLIIRPHHIASFLNRQLLIALSRRPYERTRSKQLCSTSSRARTDVACTRMSSIHSRRLVYSMSAKIFCIWFWK
ncbi:hypothetical protein PHYSODRAFT_509834, partial [Phytophthora sojae]